VTADVSSSANTRGTPISVLETTQKDENPTSNGDSEAPSPSERYDALLEGVTDAIVVTDARGAVESINPAACDLFDYNADEVIGRSLAALLGNPHQDEYAGQLRAYAKEQDVPVLGLTREALGRRKDSSSFPIELTLSEMKPYGNRMLVAVIRDISERKKAEAQLRHLAEHDALTALINNRRFEQEIDKYLDYATRYGGAGSILVIGIDSFKYLNDALGHKTGDELLQKIAGQIRSRMRKTDVLARLAGDQFGVLLHESDTTKTAAIAEELRSLVESNKFIIERQSFRVTVSIGVTQIDDLKLNGKELVGRAEAAMYEAKEKGRNTVEEFKPESQTELQSKRAWSERIRNAVDQGRFVLLAQPILDLAAGTVNQYEMLIRMRSDGEGLISPGAFLPTAERFGMIQGIDRWVAQQAIRTLSRYKRAGKDVTLEINLSGLTMTDPDFALMIGRELVKQDVDPSKLVFEVTETAAVADIEQARKFAESLNRVGCRFALDDFGSGFASFYYLKHLPISYLKIDGEFVKDLPRSPTDQLVIKALVSVAEGLGIKTVAEFVEDQETLELLRKFGVTYAQGYHIGRPGPLPDIDEPAESKGPEPTKRLL
jgi:diguanylate cyclase (GGDEF)-like protein/PAS domain S-box-containing protein